MKLSAAAIEKFRSHIADTHQEDLLHTLYMYWGWDEGWKTAFEALSA